MDGGTGIHPGIAADAGTGTPELFHAPSSYYSMIARLALTEARIPFCARPIDIHRRLQHQEPAYVRLNPAMTVPCLRVGERVLADSRAILLAAFPGTILDEAAAGRLAAHYGFPIDALTFGWLMRWNPLARRLLPRRLEAIRRMLLARAERHPELAAAYRERAAVFAQRVAAFDPATARARFEQLRERALAMLDGLERDIADGRFDPSSDYGPIHVLWTVFLARMQFCGLGRAIDARPRAAACYAAFRARPSFRQADIWPRLRPRLLLALIG
ncbi:MAG: glutathione S-transferase N-terminal domain-containing protein [Alphaproteobacteria bacterium]